MAQAGDETGAGVTPPKALLVRFTDQLTDPGNIKSAIMLLGLLAVVALLLGIFNGGGKFLFLVKDSDVSRGLITFLVALTTVLLAIILVLYAITTSEDKDTAKERFSQGKEVLTTLVGILGTVLGFYFGSASGTAPNPLAVSDIKFHGQQVMAHVSGGTPPYRYSVKAAKQEFTSIDNRISKDGWILESLDKQPPAGTSVTMSVTDAKDKSVSSDTKFTVEQGAPASQPAAAPATAK